MMTDVPAQVTVQLQLLGALNGIFDRCWRIVDSPLGPHLKQIDVTVSWRDRENREIIVTTLVYSE